MKVLYFNTIALISYIIACLYYGKDEKSPLKALAFKRSLLNFSILFVFYNIDIPVGNGFPIVWIFLTEILFSITHHLLHTKHLYWIHKQHHEHIIPCTTSCFDAHPIEFMVGNVLSFVLPMYIYKGPLWFQIAWTITAVVNTVQAHSSPGLHKIHHEKRKVNYGASLYMYDWLINTKEYCVK